MIDDLLDIRVFVSVAGSGSLSSAARGLDMSLAAVSKRLAALERRLGFVLMHRTTRSQSMTAEGQAFLKHCQRILSEVQSAETLIAVSRHGISGQLSIAAPRAFGMRHLAPLVAEFHRKHPALDVRLMFGDDPCDLVGQGVDLCFRFGALADSTFSARAVAPNYQILCAAPDYLARCGTPASVAELIDHSCIVQGTRTVQSWALHVEGRVCPVDIRTKFVVNGGEAARALALRGVGICLASIWDVTDDLDNGGLVPVLPDCAVPDEPVQVVFPHGRHIAPRVRHFLDFAVDRLRADRTWEREWMTPTKPPTSLPQPPGGMVMPHPPRRLLAAVA